MGSVRLFVLLCSVFVCFCCFCSVLGGGGGESPSFEIAQYGPYALHCVRVIAAAKLVFIRIRNTVVLWTRVVVEFMFL